MLRGMNPSPLSELIEAAIRDGVFPGAVYGIWHQERQVTAAHGRYTYCPESPSVAPDTIWDLASLSKVVATTTLTMQLVEAGELRLDTKVCRLLPTFGQSGKLDLTIRNLLVHDSGLIAFRPYHQTCTTPDEVIAKIDAEGLTYPTGTKLVYSDLNMIALARCIELLTGQTLDEAFHSRVAVPLSLYRTGYFRSVGPSESPAQLDPSHCAPTERTEPWRLDQRRLRSDFLSATATERKRTVGTKFPDQEQYIQGEVHDPTAMTLGGVAGHAGLFSTVEDLLNFLVALRSGRLVGKETVSEFTRKQSDLSSRALGWDTKSPEGSSAGTRFGLRSFGHTGYTGTSIWVDPDRDLIVVLLTNRVHPTSENTKLLQFRPKFHDVVVEALTD